MDIKFLQKAEEGTSVIAFVSEENFEDQLAGHFDQTAISEISLAAKTANFAVEEGKTLHLVSPSFAQGVHVALIALSEKTELDFEKAGSTAYDLMVSMKVENVNLVTPKSFTADQVALIANGVFLKSYRFDKYQKDAKVPSLKQVLFVTETAAEEEFAQEKSVSEGVRFARDLVTEPGNIIYPETLYLRAKEELEPLGVEVTALETDEMAKLGMGALLGVAQGSDHHPRLIVAKYNGTGGDFENPIAFVGKGVTFDTGGISLKPGAGMEEMKFDMGGSATVLGAIRALAARKAKVNVVAVVGAVENMPSARAQRPGDVVTTMSGQTIEVINTDAEGRLVLADALYYTEETFNPAVMVDVATLTGAVMIALGDDYAGIMTNSDDLCVSLTDAGQQVGEKLWRLPLGGNVSKAINSDIADMKNMGAPRLAGSSAGGELLSRFVRDVPWAHLDIAGMAWTKSNQPLTPKGATGYGVRLLNSYVKSSFE